MAVIKIQKDGSYINAMSHTEVIRGLAQMFARDSSKAVANALVNNSGGTAGEVAPAPVFVNVAADGSNLAPKAGTETNLNLVKDALLEIYTKANAYATAIGLPTVTYNGGGTTVDDEILAIGVSVTGATTGVQAAAMNTTAAALNNSIYNAAVLVNRVAEAVGLKPVKISGHFDGIEPETSISAITVDGGTAASPGVTKAQVDAALVGYRNAVKALGDTLVAVDAEAGNLLVIAV